MNLCNGERPTLPIFSCIRHVFFINNTHFVFVRTGLFFKERVFEPVVFNQFKTSLTTRAVVMTTTALSIR